MRFWRWCWWHYRIIITNTLALHQNFSPGWDTCINMHYSKSSMLSAIDTKIFISPYYMVGHWLPHQSFVMWRITRHRAELITKPIKGRCPCWLDERPSSTLVYSRLHIHSCRHRVEETASRSLIRRWMDFASSTYRRHVTHEIALAVVWLGESLIPPGLLAEDMLRMN